jgi:hydrogenase-4 component B
MSDMHVGPLLLLAGTGLLIAMIGGRFAARVWLGSTVVAAGAGLWAALSVLAGGAPWEWRSAFQVGGEPVHLRLDSLSAVFVALLGAVGGLGTVYAREYWADRTHPRSAPAGRVWWSAMLGSLGLVLLSSDGLHFLLAWELVTVTSYFLITLDRGKDEVRAAGWLYLGASHAATLCLFAFFSILAARNGGWDLGPMRGHTELAPLFWLALAGFGVKAGMFPLHVWLPSAHANAPSHMSAILSGVTIKLGIYGMMRFSGWMPVPGAAGWVVALLGVASAVLGVAFALGQHDLKRLLAYHSVENIGIILIGFGFALIAANHGNAAWGEIALAGGLLHVWNHGLFKSLLFFGGGSVLHATHTREMSRLGGLWRRMPWTTGLFALGAAAISGIPPLNGFVSEWLVYLGLFDAVNGHGKPALAAVFAAALLAVTGALALTCFIKVCGVVFLGAPRTSAAEGARECGLLMRVPMAFLAAGCVAIGLAPMLVWPAVARAAADWNPAWGGVPAPVSLASLGSFHVALAAFAAAGVLLLWIRVRRNGLRRAPTWDCGYAEPTPRMQYTAGSFSGIVTEWFSWILCPVRRGERPTQTFPTYARLEEHTPETVLVRVVEPAAGAVMRLSNTARRMQRGRSQAYLLYLALGLVALGLIVVWGAKP